EFGTMNSGTVEAGANYTLENPTGTPLGTLAGLTGFYDGATKIVTFFPLPWTLTSLAPNNTFKVTVAAGVQDSTGKGIDPAANSWSGTVADSTQPTVLGCTLNKDADTAVVVFQENDGMATAGAGDATNGNNYTLTNPTGTPLGTLAGLTGFYDGATKIVTFFPLPWTLTSLAPNNTFKVTVAAGVQDSTGKGIDPAANSWSGTVADSTQPTVLGCTLNKDADTAVVVFQENDGMATAGAGDATNGNNYTLTVGGNPSAALAGVTGVLAADTPAAGLHTVTFSLAALAATKGDYTLTATSVQDAAGNAVGAANSCSGYVQKQNPTVVSASAQPDTLTVTFTEDDAMGASATNGSNYTLTVGGVDLSAAIAGKTGTLATDTPAVGQHTVTFTGINPVLTPGASFTITAGNAVTDRSGLPVGAANNAFTGAVVPGPLDHVEVWKNDLSAITDDPTVLTVGTNYTFQAKSFDQWNNPRAGDVIAWSLYDAGAGQPNEGVGTIDANTGLFSAGNKAATYTDAIQVSATSGALVKTDRVSVTLTPAALASVTIAPDPQSVAANGTFTVTATAKDANGNVIPGAEFVWAALDANAVNAPANPTVGTFQAKTVAGAYPNAVQVTATVGADQTIDTAQVDIVPAALDKVKIYKTDGSAVADNPTVLTVGSSHTYKFTAKAFDIYGNVRSGHTFQWTVSNGGTLAQDGTFTAGNTAGTFTNAVRVTTGSKSDTVSVRLDPEALDHVEIWDAANNQPLEPVTLTVASTRDFEARSFDQYGNQRSGDVFAWSLLNAGAGEVNEGAGEMNSGGVAGRLKAGQLAKTFTNVVQVKTGAGASEKTDTLTVTVSAGALAKVKITPDAPSVALSGTQQFTAEAYDEFDNKLTGYTFAWSVENGGGSISPTGLFAAGTTAGPFAGTVKAATGGKYATTDVTVLVGTLHHVAVTPASVSLAALATQTTPFEAKAYDQYGNEIAGQNFSWSVENGGGTVAVYENPPGTQIPTKALFTAGTAAGTFANTVKASVGGKSAFASVTVQPGPVDSLAITPATTTLTPTATQQFSAKAYDEYGNQRVGQSFTWSVDAGVTVGGATAGTISETGLFTAGTKAGSYPESVMVAAVGAPGGVQPAKAAVTIQ
ncbi:MAG: hypothetical protein GW880_31240, partial [Armatimonadetes bacterium]|nr:hypothetical protein [Armatimonadota bacterium]